MWKPSPGRGAVKWRPPPSRPAVRRARPQAPFPQPPRPGRGLHNNAEDAARLTAAGTAGPRPGPAPRCCRGSRRRTSSASCAAWTTSVSGAGPGGARGTRAGHLEKNWVGKMGQERGKRGKICPVARPLRWPEPLCDRGGRLFIPLLVPLSLYWFLYPFFSQLTSGLELARPSCEGKCHCGNREKAP